MRTAASVANCSCKRGGPLALYHARVQFHFNFTWVGIDGACNNEYACTHTRAIPDSTIDELRDYVGCASLDWQTA